MYLEHEQAEGMGAGKAARFPVATRVGFRLRRKGGIHSICNVLLAARDCKSFLWR